ncbi:MAG: site-specific integrase [Agrococcus casei]|uniref:site-specific integrase n=1 Tax=Agrococcus casei TaxID=343512 RepID=UPI003F97C9D6
MAAAMTSRRSKGEGSLFKTDDGWRGYITIHGKRHYVSGGTKRAARAALDELVTLRRAGVAPSRLTVGTWLDDWAAGADWTPRTRRNNEFIIEKRINPALGAIPLNELTPEDVEAWGRGLGIKPTSVRRYASVLVTGINYALKRGLVVRNVAELARLPKVRKPTTTAFSLADVQQIFLKLDGHRSEAKWKVALMLGLRPSETLGLTWDNVNLTAGTLEVKQQLRAVQGGGFTLDNHTKTEQGSRLLHMSPSLVRVLERHRQSQLQERLDSEWKGWEHDLVFSSVKGTPIGDRVDRNDWHAVLDLAGLPHVRRYQARHTAATLQLMQSGQDVAVVAKNLGHTNPAFTYNTYVHPMLDKERALADAMDAILTP